MGSTDIFHTRIHTNNYTQTHTVTHTHTHVRAHVQTILQHQHSSLLKCDGTLDEAAISAAISNSAASNVITERMSSVQSMIRAGSAPVCSITRTVSALTGFTQARNTGVGAESDVASLTQNSAPSNVQNQQNQPPHRAASRFRPAAASTSGAPGAEVAAPEAVDVQGFE